MLFRSVCEKFDGLNFENIRKILIADKRIGGWGLYDSLFAGGSCFIKDARSLFYQLKSQGVNTDIIDSILTANQRQLDTFLARAKEELNFDWKGKTVGILGLAFKQDTNDVRNSASLKVAEFLFDQDVAKINAFDPTAGNNYLKYFANNKDSNKINLVDSEIKAISDVDVLIIATDWPQFRELTQIIKNNLSKGAIIMDGRRILQHKYKEFAEAGYNIIAVGSPLIKAV